MEMKIEKWQVENGIAKPFDDYIVSDNIVMKIFHQNFQRLIKENTFATNAPSGIHSAEMFGEVVWQSRFEFNACDEPGDYNWIEPIDTVYDKFSNFKEYQEHGNSLLFETRQFLPFKHPVEPNDKQPVEKRCWCETCGQDIIGNKCGCYVDQLEKAQLVIGDTAFTKIKDGSIQIITKNGCIELYPDELNELSNFVEPINPNANAIKDLQNYKGEAYYKQYTGELLDILYHRFYEQYNGKASETEKKEAFYEWLNDQIKQTTF